MRGDHPSWDLPGILLSEPSELSGLSVASGLICELCLEVVDLFAAFERQFGQFGSQWFLRNQSLFECCQRRH